MEERRLPNSLMKRQKTNSTRKSPRLIISWFHRRRIRKYTPLQNITALTELPPSLYCLYLQINWGLYSGFSSTQKELNFGRPMPPASEHIIAEIFCWDLLYVFLKTEDWPNLRNFLRLQIWRPGFLRFENLKTALLCHFWP